MLPGTRVLTAAEFEQQHCQAQPADLLVVCYCTVGYRSGRYAADLLAQGLQAANLQGGILAWVSEG
jgi:rhodanese-related sulfurtransferase